MVHYAQAGSKLDCIGAHALAKSLGIGRNTYQLLLLFAAILLTIAAIYTDVRVWENGMKETSLVETSQSALIFLSALFFALGARQYPEKRGYLALVATLFFCMFVRENDAFLDVIKHGFWRVPVLLTLCIGAVFVIPNRRTIGASARHHAQDSAFWFIAIGFFQLLVFSRLFGSRQLWGHALEQDAGLVKTTVQESTELMCYALIFLGSYLSHKYRYGDHQASTATSSAQ